MPVSEFLMWQVYLDEQMNTPGKSEYYLAQIALEVRRLFSKKRWKLSDFLNPVKFTRKVLGREKEMSVEQRTVVAKNFFAALTGKKVTHGDDS